MSKKEYCRCPVNINKVPPMPDVLYYMNDNKEFICNECELEVDPEAHWLKSYNRKGEQNVF